MLHHLRKAKRGVTMMLLIGFVAVLMIGFGVNINRKQPHLSVALKVNDTEISHADFARREQMLTEMYRQQFKANFDKIRPLLRLEQRTIDDFIRDNLVSEFYSHIGMTASKAQVEEKIKNDPWFQKNPLTEQNFNYYLQIRGVTAAGLEEDVKKEIVSEQLETVLADLNVPTDMELRSAFIRENTKAEFAYLGFRPADFEKLVDVKDEAKLKEYFEKNAERYKTARAVSYNFIKFDPANYLDKVPVQESDVQEMYESRIAEFEQPMQIKLREIVVRKPGKTASAVEDLLKGKDEKDQKKELQSSDESLEAKRKKIAGIHEQLEAGAEFAKLATENSEAAETAKNGGDRGWLSVGIFDKPIRHKLEALDKGGYTEIIDSPEAWTIYFAEDIKEMEPKPLADVRAELENEMRVADSPEYARIAAEQTMANWGKDDARNLSLNDFAAKEKLTAASSGGFLTADQNPSDPAAAGLTAKVISLPKGEKEVVSVNQLEFLVEVVDQREAATPDFSTVKERVVKDYRAEKSVEMAREAASTAIKELRGEAPAATPEAKVEKKSLQQIAAAHSLTVKNTEAVTRASQSTDEFLNAPGIRQKVFTLTPENPYPQEFSAGGDGTLYVYQLIKATPPSDEEINKEQASLRDKEREKIKSRITGFLVEGLKAAATIWVDPKLMGQDRIPEPEMLDL